LGSLILIIGGTRGTGLLIARLLEQNENSVRVLARNVDRARTALGPNVEIVSGDITKPETLKHAVTGAKHIIFTAGCRSGRPASEKRVKETEYEGLLNTIASAQAERFGGRFLYMTSSGVATQSWLAACLNLYKGNTLSWRRRAEDALRRSGLDYTIIRTGMLQNKRGGQRPLKITQQQLPLSIRYGVARADVAQVFVTALAIPSTSRATFEVVWTRNEGSERWPELLERLKPDRELSSAQR